MCNSDWLETNVGFGRRCGGASSTRCTYPTADVSGSVNDIEIRKLRKCRWDAISSVWRNSVHQFVSERGSQTLFRVSLYFALNCAGWTI